MKVIEIKAASVVLDFNLYPRHRVDDTHVLHIREAYRAGAELPPVVIDKTSKRATDGFHRVTATLKEFGEDASIMAEVRDYPDEAAMLLDAMLMNSGHGNNLSPFDRVRCITLAEEFKIDTESIAKALRTSPDNIESLRITRTARKSSGAITPIKAGLGHLAGRKLSKRQQVGNERLGGMSQPTFYVNQVILLIESNLLNAENVKLLERLAHLRDLLNGLDLDVEQSA